LGALVQIEMCVKEIDLWMVKNKLKLNGDKTELLVINARNRLCPAVEYIEVSNSRIQPSTSARNIGVTFDQHMSMDKHVTNICKNCFFHLRKITRIKEYLSTSDIQTLVHALLHRNWIIVILYYTDCLNFLLIGYRMCKTVLLDW
jgi:hypothetical protein